MICLFTYEMKSCSMWNIDFLLVCCSVIFIPGIFVQMQNQIKAKVAYDILQFKINKLKPFWQVVISL